MSSLVENADGSVTVQATPLKALISETFFKLGCSDSEASRIAERLAGANLRGHDSHGVIRAPRYASYIEEGRQIPNVTVDVKIENECFNSLKNQGYKVNHSALQVQSLSLQH